MIETTIRTGRLTGRAIRTTDAPLLEQIWAEPEAARWLSVDEAPASEMVIADGARRLAAHWRAHGFGLYMFFEDSRFAGYAGLMFSRFDGAAVAEIAWAMRTPVQGRGLATEAARAVLDAAPDLGLREIWSFTRVENTPSRRVMEKLGFRFERVALHAGLPHVLYRHSG